MAGVADAIAGVADAMLAVGSFMGWSDRGISVQGAESAKDREIENALPRRPGVTTTIETSFTRATRTPRWSFSCRQ